MVIQNKMYSPQNWDEFLDKAFARQDSVDGYDDYKKRFISSMGNYFDENNEMLTECYSFYETAVSTDFFKNNYSIMDEKNLRGLLSQCKVLVLTANPIEKAIFHYFISQQTHEKIRRILCDNAVYFILKWGKYWVAHVPQIETGAYKDHGANSSLQEALKHFIPNVIFSLGVAFGIDYESQQIGDVIVSKRILPYSENKRDENIIKPDRNQDKTIDNWLHVRFLNTSGFLDGVTYGDVLSGGSVMSSFSEKDRVCLGYSKKEFIVGGEMEGAALFQYAKTYEIPCAVVKGICDWGVAKNDIFDDEQSEKEKRFKDGLQAYAMAEVMKKCQPLFVDKTIFDVPKSGNIQILTKRYTTARNSLIVSVILIILLGCYFSFFTAFDNIRNSFMGLGLIIFAYIIWFINSNFLQILLRIRYRRAMSRMNTETSRDNNDIEKNE